jgi:GT2 family glycosyltransferase
LSASRAGWQVVFYPHAGVIHLGGQSSVKTGERVSAKGRQMIGIRITSEYRFYRKLYGRLHVLLAAGIELTWNAVVYLRNGLSTSSSAGRKREEAKTIMQLIIKTLHEDRWGRGIPRVH